MIEVGDRVQVQNTHDLIREVRGQYGWVRGKNRMTTHSFYVELDNGAKPDINFRGDDFPFYTFEAQYLTIIEREIIWEV